MRKLYLDNIKWITIVLVAIYHVIYMYNGVETAGIIGPFKEVQYQDAFLYIVYPWFMLLLFVIAGMNSRFNLEKHTNREFIKSRTTRLLIPSTIGLFVFWWILGYFNLQISGALPQMGALAKPIKYVVMSLSGTGPLWFIQTLWLFSIILIAIRVIEKDRLYAIGGKVGVPMLIAFAVLIWGSAQILNVPVVTVYRFGIYGLGFMIGYFVLSHDEIVDKLEKRWLPLSIAAVILAIASTIIFFGRPYAEAEVLRTALCNIYAWIAVLAIVAAGKHFGNRSNFFTEWMIKRSWGLYLFQYMVLAAFAWTIKPYIERMPVWIIYVLTSIAVFAGSYILYEVIIRIPFLRWCVCGIGGKKNVLRKSN